MNFVSKMVVNIPSELMRAIDTTDPEKPYDICLNCEFLQESCDGPNILAMEYHRWVEWANRRAKQLYLTRAQISEQANLPKSTLDSILSGRTQDIRASTMRAITKVLIGGCWGQYPCHIAALLMTSEELRIDEQIASLQKQLDDEKDKNVELRAQLSHYHEIHEKELATVRAESQRKTDWLKERSKVMDGYINDQKESIKRKEKTIAALCVVLGLLAASIIGVLIYDKMNSDVGWFRGEEVVQSQEEF